jgi:hypothetical protein
MHSARFATSWRILRVAKLLIRVVLKLTEVIYGVIGKVSRAIFSRRSRPTSRFASIVRKG